MNQTTIKEPCILKGGVGLHTGKKTDLFFHPAPSDHGVVFYRKDKEVEIPANYKFAEISSLCTTIVNQETRINTVEHLLSVCNGMGIDNLLIELQDDEVPIMDGSGLEFYNVLQKAGIKELDAPKKIIKITGAVTYRQDDIVIIATPSEHPVFTFSIEFNHKQLGAQEHSFQLTEKNYLEKIVRAKTFGFRKDFSALKKQGLIKGGSDRNAIILDEEGNFENMEIMTWLNEPNLHKILDQIGDFYLADNMRIHGNIFSHKSGHASHLRFIKLLLEENKDKFVIMEDV